MPPTFTPSLPNTTWLAPEPAVTLLKLTASLVAMLILPLVWVTLMFLSASTVTVSPALISSLLVEFAPNSPSVVFAVVRVKPALLMALAISPAVANLLVSAGVSTAPVLPTVNGVVAVLSFNWATFTASVSAVPAVTPVILPASLMVTLPNFGLSASLMLITPLLSTSVRIFLSEAVAALSKVPLILKVSPNFLTA